MDKSVVGDLINFRGLVYSPMNENGVIFLFGKIAKDLNMYVEEIKPGFPDCVARRFTGRGWERVYIEFEYRSSHFKDHKHDASGCDMLVCWEHDWPECPKCIEVVELKEYIAELIEAGANEPIQRPDATVGTELPVESHLGKYPEKVRQLFWRLDGDVRSVSDEIWRKVMRRSPGVTYYSPERVFVYVDFQKGGLRLSLFTRGEQLPGVKSLATSTGTGGAKWGQIRVKDEPQLKTVLPLLKQSHQLIQDAIKNSEPTGWYAPLQESFAFDDEEVIVINESEPSHRLHA
jgi:predicted transport protein